MLPISFILIVGPSALWFWQVARLGGVGAAVTAATAGLLSLSLLNLFTCYFTEPGLLPVVDAPGTSQDERPRKLVVIPGSSAEPRELVDFRAKYCRETGNVVEVFDHFCPWTGNAVGRRNYRYYFSFLVFTTALALLVGGTSLSTAMADTKPSTTSSPPPSVYVLWLLVLFTVVILLLVGGLLAYHIPLVSSNRTTNETIKEVYAMKANPYDRGCFQNWVTFLSLVVQSPRPSYVESDAAGGSPDSEEDRAGLLFSGP
eukprot:g2528.t1